jgi:tyrosine-specific transport protein
MACRLTSFLAQSLSLSHFLDDGLQAKKTAFAQIGICILTLLPPLILALLFPNLFYTALNFAGGICTVVLFGIIPALMIWKGRYIKMVQLKKLSFLVESLLLQLFYYLLHAFFFMKSPR